MTLSAWPVPDSDGMRLLTLKLRFMPSRPRITPDRAVLGGLLLTAAVYFRDLQYDFLLDDVPFILLNETITCWRNWATLFVPPIVHARGLDAVAVHYRPISMLWLMANYQLFGMVLPWWHLSSLLLHLLVILLVYKVGLKLLREPWTAALAAILFAFHPVHVEAVAYLSASTDLLVGLFMLISFLAYSHFREHPGTYWYLVGSLLAAALAMLSKETGAALPLMLVAYEMFRERRPDTDHWSRRFLWTLPYFGLVFGYSAIRSLGNLGPGPSGHRPSAVWDIPLVLVTYLRSLAWPVRLSFYYPVEWSSQWTIAKGVAVILVLVAWGMLWVRYKERCGLRLQLLWLAILFIIPLSCVFAFQKEDWIHDRHMYVVSIPFCLLLGVVLSDLKLPRKTAVVTGAMLAATLLIVIAIDVPRFKDELTVYQSALKVAPHNILLRRYYAAALWNSVRDVREPSTLRDEALGQFRINIEVGPGLELDYINYGTALDRAGLDEQAIAQYKRALQLDPGEPTHLRATTLYRLAGVDLRQGQLDEAEKCIREAVKIEPKAMSFHGLLAEVLKQRGREKEAAEQMQLEASIKNEFIREGAFRKPPQRSVITQQP